VVPVCPADPVRWKDAPLAREVFVLHNLMMRVADRLVMDLGLTGSRWQLLGALEAYPEAPSLTELTSDGLLTLQNVSRMVAAMEEDGLLERFQRPGGGRTVYVRVTAKGERVREEACARGKRFSAAFLEGMRGQDVIAMERWLDGMIRSMERFESRLALETDAERKAGTKAAVAASKPTRVMKRKATPTKRSTES
jgi:DNA-binding MarR family transcriptional regulator